MAPSPVGAAGGGSRSAPERPAPGAWRDLPAIQETVGPPPLVAPTEPFAADLTAPQPPAVLAELRHERGLSAPAGLVVGIARAVAPPLAETTPLPLRPAVGSRTAQREVAGGLDDGPLPGEASALDSPGAGVSTAGAPGAPSGLAPRRVPVVRPDGGDRTPLLTRLSVGDEARLALARPSGVVSPPRAPTTIQRIAPTPESTRSPMGADKDEPSRPLSSAPLTVTRMRRVGLGPPLGHEPRVSMPLAPEGRPAATSAAPSGAISRMPASTTAEASAELSGAMQAAPLPILQRSSRGRPPEPVPEPPSGSGAEVAEPPPPPAMAPSAASTGYAARKESEPASRDRVASRQPRLPQVPLLGTPPLPRRIRRAPLTAVKGPESGQEQEPRRPATGLDLLAPVPIHRGDGVGEAGDLLGAQAFTHAGEVPLPASHGALDAPPARSLLAHELTHVVQQRAFGASLPEEDSPLGGKLEAQAVATRASRPPLLPTPAAGRGTTSRQADRTATATRSARSPAATSARDGSDQATTHLPAVQRAEATPPSPPPPEALAAPGPTSEQELEELARRLYDRLRSRLARELLMDRERAGLVTGL